VGWRCAFGPKSCFDFQQGYSVIALSELTSEDYHYLRHAPVGGYESNAPLAGGVCIEEPGEQGSIGALCATVPVNTALYNNDNSMINLYTGQSTLNQQAYDYRQAKSYYEETTHITSHSSYKPHYRMHHGRGRDFKRSSWTRSSRSRSPSGRS
jgi:hypothetical protein